MRRASARKGVKSTGQLFIRGDGVDWIWNLARTQFPGSHEIVDFYHAAEHIAHFAASFFGEGSPVGAIWFRERLHQLKHLGPQAVIGAVKSLPVRKKNHRLARDQLVSYIAPRVDRMDYPSYITQGWDMGSGPVESACKEIITARLKRGCRWQRPNAINLANMRALFLADEWDHLWMQILRA